MADSGTNKALEFDFDFVRKPGETDDQFWGRFNLALFAESDSYKKIQAEKAQAETKH
jgi:hypothetical protein